MKRVKPYLFLIVFNILSLIPFVYIFILVLIPLFICLVYWLIKLIILAKDKDKFLKKHLLFSPFVFLFIIGILKGTIGYLTGDAHLYYRDKDDRFYTNYRKFDFNLRVYYYDNTCPSFYTLYSGISNDFVVKSLVKLFGFQRNLYGGHIPEYFEINNLVDQGKVLKIYLDSSDVNFISFKFNEKQYNITAKDYSYNGADFIVECHNSNPVVANGIMIPDKWDSLPDVNHKLYPFNLQVPYFFCIARYFPLLIAIDNPDPGGGRMVQLIDLENKIVFANYSIDQDSQYGTTFFSNE